MIPKRIGRAPHQDTPSRACVGIRNGKKAGCGKEAQPEAGLEERTTICFHRKKQSQKADRRGKTKIALCYLRKKPSVRPDYFGEAGLLQMIRVYFV
jgi:hypothetical protein